MGDRGERWRGARTIGALATLLCAAAVVPAVALGAYGAISGTVTQANGGAPIQGIGVCAVALNGELLSEEEREHAFACAETGAAGTYTISELIPESYGVLFLDGPSPGLDFIPQVYDEKALTAGVEPTPVPVTAGATTPNIDAKMLAGARISGRVTAAATGAPIEHAIAIAIGSESELGAIARTNSNGEYTLGGLPTGSYTVAFSAMGYEDQYFDHKALRKEASTVSVTVPETTSGIDASLAPGHEPPPGSGGPGPEGPESEGPGSGSGAGAAGSPLGTGVGSHGARPEGKLSLLGRRISVRARGRALVELRCAGHAPCRAKVTLRLRRTTLVKGRRKSVFVAIGTSSVLTIAGSRKLAATVSLNGLGRTLLRLDGNVIHAEIEVVTPGHKRDLRVVLSSSGAGSARARPRFTG